MSNANAMEVFVEEPFLASSKSSDRSRQHQIDHQLLLLRQNVRHTWWLKVLLVLLYFPIIVIYGLSYFQWSESGHPQPQEHYVYPDMIPSKSKMFNRR